VRVEPGRGLIEKDDLRVRDQRNGDPDPLLGSAGKRVQPRVGLVLQMREIHQRIDVGAVPEYAGVELKALAHRDAIERAEILRQHTDPPNHRGLALGDVHAEDRDLSRRGLADGLDHLGGRALPRAVGAEEREHLARLTVNEMLSTALNLP
jgi:hypothetical protein